MTDRNVCPTGVSSNKFGRNVMDLNDELLQEIKIKIAEKIKSSDFELEVENVQIKELKVIANLKLLEEE